MDERLGFLRAIREAPEDDALRSVFADWLDDHGEREQAEFIRVQLELDPVRGRLEDERTRELIDREWRLRLEQTGWVGSAHEFEGRLQGEDTVGYDRGLPEWTCLSLDTLLSGGEHLFAALPTLRELAVYGVEGRGAELADCPLLGKVDVLEVADALTGEDVDALAASSHLRAVHSFRFFADWDYDHSLAIRLAESSTPSWPSHIDMVWLTDGLAAGIPAEWPEPPLDEGSSYAHPINALAGRELAHDVRPATRLFPFRGRPFDAGDEDVRLGLDTGYCLHPGRLPNGAQALAVTGTGDWCLVTFDEHGLVTDIDKRPCPVPESADRMEWRLEVRAAGQRWVTETLQLVPAVVRMREFEASGQVEVRLWPRWLAHGFDTWHQRHQLPDHDRQGFGGTVSRWLRDGNFVIDDALWADWRGEINSS